ncbi:histidinol-phosphatase [Coprobacter sp.]
MNNRTNYHTHSTYCDGLAPIEDFVKEAIKQDFSSYGVSSHSPVPFDTCWNMKRENLPAYLREVRSIKDKYKDRIEIYTGLEIDYLDAEYNPSSSEFQELPLDYRIGSVHFLKTDDGYVDIDTAPAQFRETVVRYFGGDVRVLVKKYFETMMQMICTGGFDFVGHADKVSMNALSCLPGITGEIWYKSLIREYFEFISKKDCMIEINTKAWRSKNLFFPNREHFGLIHKLQIPVVVNADTHHPSLVNDGRFDALKEMLSEGFTHVRQLSGGQWVDVEIII